MSDKTVIDPEIVIEAYLKAGGNKTEAARSLGIHRETLRKLLGQLKADLPVSGGTTKPLKNNVLELPAKGKIARYILSSAQNNTKVFSPFLKNLEAYCKYLRQWGDCQIMLARYVYDKSAYLASSLQKPGHAAPLDEGIWYDPAVVPYICDRPSEHGTCRWQLATDLFWCAELQISPTATSPLSGLGTYTGTASSIFPHTKIAVEAVASVPGTPTKHVYTTGTVTGRNYIQKKAGLKAQFHHEFGAVLVEVNSDGDWWLRHLSADSKGNFYDVPGGVPTEISNGEITVDGVRVEAINWGDTHVEELPEERKHYYWIGSKKQPAVVDCLRPKAQFHNDLHSFRARNHHEFHSFGKRMEKYVTGMESVQDELSRTSDFLAVAERSFCLSVVVNSNHDRFGERWLDEANYKHDLPNAEFFLEAQLARVRAIKSGEGDKWMFLEWALKRAGCPETVRFLQVDETFTICKKTHPIDVWHGDLGVNGSRGSTASLSKAGSKINKGHDHTYGKRDAVWSAGVCSLDHGYNKGGLTTWSITHIITYLSGKRTGLTERAGKLWA